jgi:hypothetical protein
MTTDIPRVRRLEEVLGDLCALLVREGNTRAAEQVFQMVVAAAAAEEVMTALERGDDEATRFHTELMERCLGSATVPEFRVRE